MKARTQITNKQKKAAEQYLKEYSSKYLVKERTIAAKRMYLLFLAVMRFEFGFKKRLMDVISKTDEYYDKIFGLLKDDCYAEYYVDALETSGVRFDGYFDELIEYERQVQKEKDDARTERLEHRKLKPEELEALKKNHAEVMAFKNFVSSVKGNNCNDYR